MKNRWQLVLCLAALTPNVSRAESAEETKALSGLMGDSGFALVRIQTAKLTPEAAHDAINFVSLLGHRVQTRADWAGLAKRLSESEVGRFYGVLEFPLATGGKDSLEHLPWNAPVSGDAAAGVEATMRQHLGLDIPRGWSCEKLDGFVVAGPKEAIAGRRAASTSPRRGLEQALAATGDAPVAIVFVPTADQRRALLELAPDLLQLDNAEAAKTLLRQSAWVVASLDAKSPKVVLRTNSAADATAVAPAVTALLASAKKAADGYGDPVLAKTLDLIEARASGDRVEIVTSDPAAFMTALSTSGATRAVAIKSLKQIGLAMHNYVDAHSDADGRRRFPDAASLDSNGRPLLSWRVHILPYLDEESLYREFKLNEPWDSEHNRKLIPRMPRIYALGSRRMTEEGKTSVVLPIGDATMFPGGKGRQFKEITDGTSNTILAVLADDEHAAVWTRPDDLSYDAKEPIKGLSRQFGHGFLALFADGSVQFLDESEGFDRIRGCFTAAGREPRR